MRRAFRVLYAAIALLLFLSLPVAGAVLLLRPELADAYLRRVVFVIVVGAVILLAADIIGRYMDRR